MAVFLALLCFVLVSTRARIGAVRRGADVPQGRLGVVGRGCCAFRGDGPGCGLWFAVVDAGELRWGRTLVSLLAKAEFDSLGGRMYNLAKKVHRHWSS